MDLVRHKMCAMPTEPDEVSTREALDILGLAHPSSITRFVAEGKLTPTRRIGLVYLFDRGDVETLRDERAAKAAARAEAAS